ncbi:MAG: DM13 domain-containing protein [Gammaproteobacteria bacterium]|nr:DM13 domain-containing protein [Gammaproteobacteria bacterium]
MKNFISGLFFGVVLGFVAGFAAGIFVFPYLFPPPPVNEAVDSAISGEIVATGSFIHAKPSDPVHYGKGRVSVYPNVLHLETDFEVGPGPKFHVYLVPESDITPATRIEETMFVDLGRLKAFTGSQNYPIPAGVDLARYGSVVIWCEQFGVLVSPAMLKFTN